MTQILGQPCEFQVQDEVAAKKLAANRKKRAQKKKKKQQQQQAAAAAADRLAQEAKAADDCARLERMMESKPELRARFSDKVALEGDLEALTSLAEGGCSTAAYHLGVRHEFGRQGAPRPDKKVAAHWYLQAAEAGGPKSELAQYVLSVVLQACIPLLDLPIGELCD